jgi:N-acetylglutamate synthase
VRLTPDRMIELELVASRAWPAARQGAVGGWRLFGSSGFSGRINACWPLEDPGLPTGEAIAAVETWYRGQGLSPLFKLVEGACTPADLAARLQALGYRSRTETIMMLGPAAGRSDAGVRVSDGLDETFAAVFAATAPDPGDARERLQTLARIPRPRAFARAEVNGEAAAIGAAAAEGQWCGVFAMRTDPRFRRRGLARRVLDALLAACAAAGARRAWLQVEADNPGAIALYEAVGFAEAYRYRYWQP